MASQWRAVELPSVLRQIVADNRRDAGRHRHTLARAKAHDAPAEPFARSVTDLAEWTERLARSELYWVASAMMQLAEDAATDIPPTVLGHEMPDRTGLIAFGTPIGPIGMADRMPGTVSIWMVSWQCDADTVRLSAWCPMADLDPAQREACGMVDWGDEWAPFCDLAAPRWEIDEAWESDGWGSRLIRFICASWVLMQMPTLADTRDARPSPSALARAAKQRRKIRPVRIIDLRRLAQRGNDPNLEISSRNYTHRWVVRGHWRQQAYGPDRARRRPTYIAPYTKGPDGAPWMPSEHVSVWRR